MNTALSLLVAFMASTIGLAVVAVAMICMGFAGAPGALVYEFGKRKQSIAMRMSGILLAGLAQAFVVAAYCVFVLSLMHLLLHFRPSLPSWPLWIAAGFHTIAIPGYAAKEREAERTAQYLSLPIVSVAAIGTFVLSIVSPATLAPLFSWVPYFEEILR